MTKKCWIVLTNRETIKSYLNGEGGEWQYPVFELEKDAISWRTKFGGGRIKKARINVSN